MLCRGDFDLLRLFLPLLLARPVSAALLLRLIVGFGRRLFLLPFVVIAFSGLPLWVGALRLDVGELQRFCRARSQMVQVAGILCEHGILNYFECEGSNVFGL